MPRPAPCLPAASPTAASFQRLASQSLLFSASLAPASFSALRVAERKGASALPRPPSLEPLQVGAACTGQRG